jgi:hypothetical protein
MSAMSTFLSMSSMSAIKKTTEKKMETIWEEREKKTKRNRKI